MKKPNFEENDPNYLEEEDYEDKNDPFLEFFKDPKAKKAPGNEKEIKDPVPKFIPAIPARKKSFEELKNEKKIYE